MFKVGEIIGNGSVMGNTGLLIILIVAGVLLLVGAYDLLQVRHAILRNFPVIGHVRYLLEKIGPELRQYIVADNLSLIHI